MISALVVYWISILIIKHSKTYVPWCIVQCKINKTVYIFNVFYIMAYVRYDNVTLCPLSNDFSQMSQLVLREMQWSEKQDGRQAAILKFSILWITTSLEKVVLRATPLKLLMVQSWKFTHVYSSWYLVGPKWNL